MKGSRKRFVLIILILVSIMLLYNVLKHYHINWFDDQAVVIRTNDCDAYFDNIPALGADQEFLTNEDQVILGSNQLAFSHLVHEQATILEAFLSIYFRPNNFHCIHVDKKAKPAFKAAVRNIVKCYKKKVKHGSIFILPESESFSVEWGKNNMLKADLSCIRKLLQMKKDDGSTAWSQSISVAGNELPIVSYSSFYNKIYQYLGSDLSSVESFILPMNDSFRISETQNADRKISKDGIQEDNAYEIQNPLISLSKSESSKSSLDQKNIQFKVFKGARNVILSSKDADFIVNHQVAKVMLDWFSLGSFTEEHFYSTVIRFRMDNNAIVSQNISAEKVRKNSAGITFTSGDTLHGICPRFTDWGCLNCFGQCYRTICNFHSLDLVKIDEDSTECLIANKFNVNVDPLAVSQQWIKVLRKSVIGVIKDEGKVQLDLLNNVMEKTYRLIMN